MRPRRDHLHVEALDGADRGIDLWFEAPSAVVLGRAGTTDLYLKRLTDPSLLDCHALVTATQTGEIKVARLGPENSAHIAGRTFEEAAVSSGGLVRLGAVTVRLSLVRGDRVVGSVPRARLSHFHLVEEIGQGAFSRVYEAVERATSRPVAVKRLRIGDPSVRDTLVSAFLREIQTAASLDHPGIAQVISAGRRGDDLFLVMEFVDGPDLDACVSMEGPLGADRVRWIGRGMLEALAHAHERGVIHRDVKPSNVMLKGPGARPQVVLVDFGLAIEASCQAAWGLTYTGDFRGTPDFTAPECLADAKEHSARSDVFGVGATLYFALTGRTCRPPRTPGAAPLDALTRADVVPLTTVHPDVDGDLARVVARALEMDPAKRWPSAATMLDALEEAAADGAGA